MDTFKTKDSQVIKQVWYNAETTILSVQFSSKKSNGYIYIGVPKAVYNKFSRAKSKGKFFAKNIRDRYPSQKDVFHAV